MASDSVLTTRGGRIKLGPANNQVEYPPLCYFPIGYVYISVDPTSPAEYFGGTWQRLSKCFLYAADPNTDSSTADPFRAGQSGGSRSQTIQRSNLPNVQLDLAIDNINAPRCIMDDYAGIVPAYYKSDTTCSTASVAKTKDEVISWKYKAQIWKSKSGGWASQDVVFYKNKYYKSLSASNTATPGTNAAKWEEVQESSLPWKGQYCADVMTESLNGGVTQAALDTTPEYLSVYMWRRVS